MSTYKGYKIDGIICVDNAQGETTTDISSKAVDKLIREYDVDIDNVRVMLLVTQDEDFLFPSTAFAVQAKTQMTTDCMVYDINLGGDGFITGLETLIGLLIPYDNSKGIIITADKEKAVAALVGKCNEDITMTFYHRSYPEYWDIAWQSRWNDERIYIKEKYNLLRDKALEYIDELLSQNDSPKLLFPQQCIEDKIIDTPVSIPIMLSETCVTNSKDNYTLCGMGAGGAISLMVCGHV